MDATEHFNRGLSHYDASQFHDAHRDFTRAIELSPDYAAPYTVRGHIHLLDGNCQQAVSDFNQAIRLNPMDADAWSGRAGARYLLSEFHEAIEDCNQAIRLNPRDADCFHHRGNAHSAIENIQGAIEDYRQAVALNPENPISRYFLAWSLARTKCYADAIHHYREALRIDSNLDAEVYAFYAWLLATCPDSGLRNPTEAIRLATIACEDTGWCEDQPLGILAAAYAANGDFTAAVHWQTEAIRFAYDDRKGLQQSRLELFGSGRVCPDSEDP